MNLKQFREDNDIRQEEIAKIINVTQSTYSLYETGKRQIPYQAIIKICKKYNVSADYILGLINEERKLYKMHK